MSRDPFAPSGRVFSWVDVDDHLQMLSTKDLWPEWLLEADAYWGTLDLTLREMVPLEVIKGWLTMAFGLSSIVESEGGELSLLIDDAPSVQTSRRLDIAIEVDSPSVVKREPRWRESRIISGMHKTIPPAPSGLPFGIHLVAMHSFKGGVGRTLHGLALAEATRMRGGKVLVVDADLEAPGVSWMYAEQGREADFSFEDFITLLHSSTDGQAEDAVRIGSGYIANQSIDGVFVLPARRSLLSVAPPRIEPSDLLTPSRDSFMLSDALAELAHNIGASVVIIDLRAGNTELSASLLLDRRVKRVFVTSVSSQAVQGTVQMINELARRSPVRDIDPAPLAVITQFRSSSHSVLVDAVAARIRDALAEMLSRAESGNSEDHENGDQIVDLDLTLTPILSPFKDSLLGLPAGWDDVINLVRESGLADLFASAADEISPIAGYGIGDEQHQETDPSLDGLQSSRRMLSEFASQMVFAERAELSDFLPTESLRNLLVSHRTEVPLCVVTGSKGAGKTFTYLQMSASRTWAGYAAAVGVQDVRIESLIVPVLASRNLNDESQSRLEDIKAEAMVAGGSMPESQFSVVDRIKEAVESENPYTDKAWRLLWLTCIAQSVGLEVSSSNVEQRLAEFGLENSRVFLIDGLEDVLQNTASDARQQQALRVLLMDCVEWLRSLRGRPLGLVILVREDLVVHSIRQNTKQFLARYQEYSLKWNSSEALRLALWVVRRSQVATAVDIRNVVESDEKELRRQLLEVWGDKMGSTRSREARSDVWFLAALSDFNGQIQARDIVTFLAESARASEADTRWANRLLSPAAMRSALVECSKRKIEAIREESPAIGKLLSTLGELPEADRQIPFTAITSGLSPAELNVLEVAGVVYKEEDQYWIPEIFRHGVGFQAKGRPRVLAIANLVRKRNNLD